MYILTADEMRDMDRRTIENFELPGRLLMENAGRGATRVIFKNWPDVYTRSVAVIAGKGNNGGDGFVIARYLAQHGVDVSVYLLAERGRLKGDAAANFNLMETLGIPIIELPDELSFSQYKEEIAGRDLLVDAILGTGLDSEVQGYFREVIDFVNNARTPVFSVDIASGLHTETGRPCGICVQADATATFGFAKLGHMLLPGAEYTGRLSVIDIGIPPYIVQYVDPKNQLLTAAKIRSQIIPRDLQAHKGQTGHVLAAAGGTGKTGAAAMSAMSALRAGAGLVTLAVAQSLNSSIEAQATEAMTHPLADNGNGFLGKNNAEEILSLLSDKNCLALGPGMGTEKDTEKLVHMLIEQSPVPVVADADGLNNLAANTAVLAKKRSEVILTPHPGEMARLADAKTADIQADRITAAREFAQNQEVHVVLKGARTVVAHPDGRAFVNPTGNPGMASGGMGDVLTGMIAGFLAQGLSAENACHLGVYLHGAAADIMSQVRGPFGYIATDVMHHIPETIRRVIDGTFKDIAHDCHPMF
ncbi:MAG: NAD(P)H-hydrate dehydratase [Desulfobacteraceae bacterium]|nr:NAD(P)H-hydrate dehydratase [Desulfobacteraceae bacterium]